MKRGIAYGVGVGPGDPELMTYRAARLIREGTPANKAALDAGFGDYSAFHRAFKESFGISPGELKK